MVDVTVTPETFTMVDFDAAEIAEIAARVIDQADITGVDELRIEIDETSPLARARLASEDPLVLAVEGGAFEDTRRPRQLSPDRTADTVGRYVMKVADRRGGAFADAPPDDELTLAQAVAWDVYCVGRLSRSGLKGQRKRRLYQFRNRHGFTDAADAAFEELWNAEGLTWADVDRVSTAAREVLAVE